MTRRNSSAILQELSDTDIQPARLFLQILSWARAFWDCIEEAPQQHRARGLVHGACHAHVADLSLDRERKRLSLVVPLPRRQELSEAEARCLHKLQADANGLSSIAADEEDYRLWIHTQSVLAHPDTAREVVAAIFADTISLLEDDRLRGLTEWSPL